MVSVRQQKTGETEGERSLADASRPTQQDRVRQPTGFDEPSQFALRALVTDELWVRPWGRNSGRCLRRLL
jgi:hypothetical protein